MKSMDVENILDIKCKNIKDIIDYIRFRESWKKKEIAVDLGLSFATVSSMINEMMELGMIEAVFSDQKSVGRAPKNFTLLPDRFVSIVINIHQPGIIRMTAVNLNRKLLSAESFSYVNNDDIDQFMNLLGDYYFQFLKANHFSQDNVIGVGIVTRGMYDSSTGRIVGTFINLFQNQPLAQMLTSRIQKKVWVGNDTDFAAYESAFANNTSNLIYLYCGKGLGLGVVNNGRSLSGAFGYTAELSHSPFGELGVECPFCHHTDCLQSDVEQAGFLSKYYGRKVSSNEVTDDEWNAFVSDVEVGVPEAVRAVENNGRIIARIYSLLAGVLRPEITVLGGLPEAFYRVMRPMIEDNMNSREPQKQFIPLLYDRDYQQTVAMGAAETVYYHWKPNLDGMKKNRL